MPLLFKKVLTAPLNSVLRHVSSFIKFQRFRPKIKSRHENFFVIFTLIVVVFFSSVRVVVQILCAKEAISLKSLMTP